MRPSLAYLSAGKSGKIRDGRKGGGNGRCLDMQQAISALIPLSLSLSELKAFFLDTLYSPRSSPVQGCYAASEADILALREESKILGRYWDVLKVVTCLQSSLWASPHRPTQCSKTGLKMSDWKCEILTEPSNV